MYFLTTGRLWYRRQGGSRGSRAASRSLADDDEVQGKGEWVEADEDWITEPGSGGPECFKRPLKRP